MLIVYFNHPHLEVALDKCGCQMTMCVCVCVCVCAVRGQAGPGRSVRWVRSWSGSRPRASWTCFRRSRAWDCRGPTWCRHWWGKLRPPPHVDGFFFLFFCVFSAFWPPVHADTAFQVTGNEAFEKLLPGWRSFKTVFWVFTWPGETKVFAKRWHRDPDLHIRTCWFTYWAWRQKPTNTGGLPVCLRVAGAVWFNFSRVQEVCYFRLKMLFQSGRFLLAAHPRSSECDGGLTTPPGTYVTQCVCSFLKPVRFFFFLTCRQKFSC